MKYSGVVDQDIDSAEGRQRLFEDAFDLFTLRYIGGYRDRRPARFTGHFLNPVFAPAHQGDPSALTDQSQGTGAANAAAGAGHDGYLVFEARAHRSWCLGRVDRVDRVVQGPKPLTA